MNAEITVDIIVLTLNEESSINDVLTSFKTRLPDVKLRALVIDGKSVDNTVSLAKKAGAEVLVQKTKGKGAAMREGIDSVTSDIIAFIDGDGTYDPKELDTLLIPIIENEADMVIGSRFMGEREKGSITFLNRIGNRIFNTLVKISNNFNITDVLSGYRAVRTKSLNEIVLFSEGFEIEVELTLEFLSKNLRIKEVPISYKRRYGSKTKLKPFHDGVEIFKTLFLAMLNTRPLYFFSILSAILFFIGMYPAAIVVFEKIVYGEVIHLPSVVLSSLFVISGGLTLILGILANLIVSTRKRMEYLLRKMEQS